MPAERVWWDLVRMLPKGLPGPRDPGLDGTRDWGRTYWGGALGVVRGPDGVRFDDRAPRAAVRRAITRSVAP